MAIPRGKGAGSVADFRGDIVLAHALPTGSGMAVQEGEASLLLESTVEGAVEVVGEEARVPVDTPLACTRQHRH